MNKYLSRIALLMIFLAIALHLNADSANSEATAKVTFIRFAGTPRAVKGHFFIDGREVGQIGANRYVIFKVKAGKHELRFKFPFWTGMRELSGTTEWTANQSYYLCYESKMRPGFGLLGPGIKYSWGLHKLSEREATQAMGNLDPVDPRDWPNCSTSTP